MEVVVGPRDRAVLERDHVNNRNPQVAPSGSEHEDTIVNDRIGNPWSNLGVIPIQGFDCLHCFPDYDCSRCLSPDLVENLPFPRRLWLIWGRGDVNPHHGIGLFQHRVHSHGSTCKLKHLLVQVGINRRLVHHPDDNACVQVGEVVAQAVKVLDVIAGHIPLHIPASQNFIGAGGNKRPYLLMNQNIGYTTGFFSGPVRFRVHSPDRGNIPRIHVIVLGSCEKGGHVGILRLDSANPCKDVFGILFFVRPLLRGIPCDVRATTCFYSHYL